MKTSSSQGLFLVSGVVCASLVGLSGVDGAATKLTTYLDNACMESDGVEVLTFGVATMEEPYVLGEYNECIVNADTNMGSIMVCDDSTGETSMNTYMDETCSEVLSESATGPDCMDMSMEGECSGSYACSTKTECTDAEPSVLSRNAYQIRAIEYNDANCTDPTKPGEFVVLEGDALGGLADGTCYQPVSGFGYTHNECRDDGSILSQSFAPDDDTCSGDVWSETSTPSDSSDKCMTVKINDLYYSYVSCTFDDVTVEGSVEGLSTAAPSHSHGDHAGHTPSPAASSSGIALDMSMSPTMIGGEEATMSPTGTERGLDDDESSSDDGINAAAGGRNGIAVAAVVLSCAAGLLAL